MSGPATQTLAQYAFHEDPFRVTIPDLAELQLAAARECFAEKREKIRVLDRRASEVGINEIRTLDDLVPLLFSHTNYKSYPESFVDNGQWRNMSLWLGTLSTCSTANIDNDGIVTVDDWLARAHAAGHHVFASSGTSGKSSFMNQSAAERDLAIAACGAATNFALGGARPDGRFDIFTMMPAKATHKMAAFANSYYVPYSATGDKFFRLSDDPITAFDAMRPAQLRRLLAAGKIGPGEIAAYEATVAARQEKRAAEWSAWLDLIAAHRHNPIFFGLMWGTGYQIAEGLRARGVKDGDFHPDTMASFGGGTKGVPLPDDYKQQIISFYGFTPERMADTYGMSEVNGLCGKVPGTQSYSVPPWLIPLVLDKSGEVLVNPTEGVGTIEGRMAFFDVTADSHWGGIISGDKVVVEFGGGIDDVRTTLVHKVARYADLEEGEGKLTCAGSIDSYVRGSLPTAVDA